MNVLVTFYRIAEKRLAWVSFDNGGALQGLEEHELAPDASFPSVLPPVWVEIESLVTKTVHRYGAQLRLHLGFDIPQREESIG